MAFLQILVHNNYWGFFSKTSGYNVECDGLCPWSNRSLPLILKIWVKKFAAFENKFCSQCIGVASAEI